MTTQTTPGRHRCYGSVAVRHLVAAGLMVLPVAIAAKAAAGKSPIDAITSADPVDLVLLVLDVVFLVAGLTVWGLIEHLVAHCRATEVSTQTGPDDRWFTDEHGRWWYRP
ncbi:MAG: hypothetical protein V7603_5023 [Micromonosporaceae bacterium]